VVEPAQLAADAELLLHEQRVHEARQLLGRALTRYPDDRVLSERFDRLVSETATPAEIRSHLERRMQRLIRSGQPAVAAELWQRNRPKLGNWVPRVSQTRYRLALALDDLGEHQTAFRLLIGLPPDDERFSKIAEAWMEAARILEDDLQDSARARELRALVLRRYPERARRWLARRGETGPAEDRPASRRAASAAG
jgi:tetratricopeptide (TPR) repeat protein